jgi:hypothetical protein
MIRSWRDENVRITDAFFAIRSKRRGTRIARTETRNVGRNVEMIFLAKGWRLKYPSCQRDNLYVRCKRSMFYQWRNKCGNFADVDQRDK